MIRLGDRILLAFRGGERGQIGSERAVILVFESTDDGQTFTKISEVTMPPADSEEPGAGRDIRDPKLVQMGDKLFLYAIARLPGFTYRDLFKETWTVRSESEDGGLTWTEPARILDEAGSGFEEGWGFWRFTKRQYQEGDGSRETLYATGYYDGDWEVGFFASEDGVKWTEVSTVINDYEDAPSEAELQFFGENNEIAVSIVRLDNQGNLEDGQSAICTSRAPFEQWECGRRVEQRLDGPAWVVRREGDQIRNFIFARKHLPCTFKRTAIYEIRGDLTDTSSPVETCETSRLIRSWTSRFHRHRELHPHGQDHVDRWLLRRPRWLRAVLDSIRGRSDPSRRLEVWGGADRRSRAPRTAVFLSLIGASGIAANRSWRTAYQRACSLAGPARPSPQVVARPGSRPLAVPPIGTPSCFVDRGGAGSAGG
jgi:hypothetical protein